ncbi:hypothetical protein A8B73_02315 [Methylosinus sp. 3S-1]|nr:hypothetical protein A8B73_02315 [Methylosinus sp. 3S-1]
MHGRSLLLIPRSLERSMAAQLDVAILPASMRLRLTGDMNALPRAVADAAASFRLEPSLADWLSADILELARLYRETTRAARLVVRIETIIDDACRLFHTDNVRFRLATTYRGPGTQWLDTADLSLLAEGATPTPDSIRRMDRGWIAVMRGGKAATPDVPALPHRSPPIAGSGATRLFVAIDEALAG